MAVQAQYAANNRTRMVESLSFGPSRVSEMPPSLTRGIFTISLVQNVKTLGVKPTA